MLVGLKTSLRYILPALPLDAYDIRVQSNHSILAKTVAEEIVLNEDVTKHKDFNSPKHCYTIWRIRYEKAIIRNYHTNITHTYNFTLLFAERDAFTSQLLGVINTMATQMKGLQARNGEGNVQLTSHVYTQTESKEKMKVRRTPLEQQLNDLYQ